MSRVFVDTSALFALLVSSDRSHLAAAASFARLRTLRAPLVTSSYVLVETYALLGRRVGLSAARAFRTDFAPLLSVRWVDAELHEQGLELLSRRDLTTLSLVDAVSFVVIRQERIADVFAFDRHFTDEGLTLSV